MGAFGLGIIALVGLPLVGCGSTGNSPTSDGGPGGEAAQFVDQLADQLCATAALCCPVVGHTAPSDCVVRARQQLHDDVDAEILAGAGFDGDAAGQCLAGYRALAMGCPAIWSAPDACHQALIGTGKPGDPCDRGCAASTEGDVVCAFSVTLGGDAGEVASPKICQVEINSPPGAMCDTEVTKPILTVCDSTGGSWCFGGVCSVPVALGGACHGNDCMSGAYCSNGICQPQIAPGDACQGISAECMLGTSCDARTMTCRAADRWKRLCGGEFS